ncbi:STAS domain-containing protein [Streptomyces phaeochromogenes]|uniref:STAS domain-containing protein n=1 Tax=Streptomyces phaeochromogenes TaxID=1923 RepID=UPI0033E4AFB4
MPEVRRGPVNRGTLPMRIPPALNVHRHDTDNRTLVTLAGEIDLTSAPLVHASLERCLHDGIRSIDVDVTAVTFCDCSGLNAFLYALLHTAAAGGSLRLVHPSPALERLVTLTGSGSLFLTLPDALAGSRPPPQLPLLYETAHRLTPTLPARLGGIL